MSPWAFLAAVLVFLAGMAAGVKVHSGLIAERDLEAAHATARERIRQAEFAAPKAAEHAQAVESLNDQLVTAHGQIAQLEARPCLDARTVRVLNATGVVRPRTAASQPAGAAGAAEAAGGDAGSGGPAGSGLKWASNIDVGQYIAYCRVQHAKVVDQVTKILDIEDQRFPPAARSP